MLQEFVPGCIWLSTMPFGRLGFDVGARMTGVRLPDGKLWVHSPIALSPDLRQAIVRLGEVGHLIVPSKMHTGHLLEWANAYPEATVYAVEGARDRLQVKPGPVLLEDSSPAAWQDVFEQAVLRGSALYDEVDFVHKPSGTLVLTDLCFNIPECSNWSTRLWARSLDVLVHLSSSRSFVLSIKDRDAAKESIQRILSWDFDRVILSHGDVTERNGKQHFRQAFAWLVR